MWTIVCYNDMETPAEHIAYQLPNGRTKVQRFADSIEEYKDPKICAAIANALDTGRNMHTDFEACVSFVLPHDPVLKKRGIKRRTIVSEVTANPKPGTGKTGVALCWHKYYEFGKLSSNQKDELQTWQAGNNNFLFKETTHQERKSRHSSDRK